MADEINKFSQKYSDLFICFSHKDISLLSDRTYHALNRGFRKICQEIIEREVDLMILQFDIPENYKQSLRDRITPEIASGVKYYVEDIKKGSYEIIVMLSALATSLLVFTLGEDIKKVWQNTRLSKKFRKMMGDDLSKTDVKEILTKIQDYNKQRSNIISEQIMSGYKARVIENRFIVNDVSVEKGEKGIKVTLDVKTIREIEETIVLEKVDSAKVDEAIKELFNVIK